MTLHQAASFVVPNLGPHRNRPLACVALDDPGYLERCMNGEARECAPGTAFHEAACIVVERMRANAEADILAGRTLGADEYRRAVEGLGALGDVGRPAGAGASTTGKGKGKGVPARAGSLFDDQ